MLKFGNTFVNFGGTYLSGWVDPLNPLDLPANTIRLKYNNGVTPSFSKGTAIQVSQAPNVWDLTYNNTNWTSLLSDQTDLLEVLGANTTGVTYMRDMFAWCTSLTSVNIFNTSNVTDMYQMFEHCTSLNYIPLFNTNKVTTMRMMFYECTSLTAAPLFDTSNVTNMEYMFYTCENLTNVPLFNTSKVTNISKMFAGCYNVQYGALALYQQASTQVTPPSQHNQTFYYCGSDTETGAAELAQIPSDWK